MRLALCSMRLSISVNLRVSAVIFLLRIILCLLGVLARENFVEFALLKILSVKI